MNFKGNLNASYPQSIVLLSAAAVLVLWKIK